MSSPSSKGVKVHNNDLSGNKVIRYRNCQVLRGGVLKPGDIWVRDGQVINPMVLFYQERHQPEVTIECNRLIASPGFIDLQVNGAMGQDFSSFSNTTEAETGLQKVSQKMLEYGVTAYCPTLVTSSPDYYKMVLPVMKRKEGGKHGAAILGVHVEGPYISKEKKGAHKEEYIQHTTITEQVIVDCYGSLDNIKIITLAPELEGCLSVIPWLSAQNIVVSLGHSMAKLDTAEEAVRSGASLITHLFNAMLPFHHRDPGIVGLLTSLKLSQKQIYYGIISDGWHTHETVQRISQKSNPEGVVLVTDSNAATGLPEGIHKLGELKVVVDKQRRASIHGTNVLAGGATTMDVCIRGFLKATDCGIPAALEAASLHPAEVLGEYKKGRLDVGADADIVFLTEWADESGCGLEISATVIAGEIVWRNENCPLREV